ncbi:MAG: haloacid dehalogenase [Anaerolineaceae bacterium]|nr:haloacid dehalogenase [Anaerolineaceae bacterium]
MDKLSIITEKIHESFESMTQARDKALIRARKLTRESAQAIRAIHRSDVELANEHLANGREITTSLKEDLIDFPSLFHAGYTQDAIKEFVEATVTIALVQDQQLPDPDEMGVDYSTYLKGLAEVPGELRRRCLDLLRQGFSPEVERLLGCMDEIYAVLVTMDYPDAITHGLRRMTDLVRGILERTRGDMTISMREEKLTNEIISLHEKLEQIEVNNK